MKAPTDVHDPSRREFTLASGLALLGGVTITVSGCGGGGYMSSSPVSAEGGPPPDVSGAISDNHGHRAVILSAQVTAGGALRLNIQYQADHDHVLDLSAADLAQIKGGNQVSSQCSDSAGHHHMITFQGPTPAPGGGYY